jgi:hypothetical protein
LAFLGTPLESLDEEHGEEAVTGALLLWSLIDDTRATRIYVENYMKALAKQAKQGKRGRR